MPTIIERGFERRLRALESRAALAFMAALAERLMPNYQLWAELDETGDAHGVRSVLDLVWEALTVRDARIDFARQAEKLAECEPPPADESFGARAAGDLTAALSACMDALFKNAVEAPVEVSRLSIGGIERLIEMQAEVQAEMQAGEEIVDDDQREALIEAHALTADERAFQLAVLETVEKPPLTRERLREIRALGRNEGFSNLGISAEG